MPSRISCLTVFVLLLAAHARATCAADTRADVPRDAVHMWNGLRHAPRNALRTENLKWELPIAAATGILISSVDVPASRHARSGYVADATGLASNVVLGTELAGTGMLFAYGCAGEHQHARRAAWAALEAGGYGITLDMVLKSAFNRQYPYTHQTYGEFWEGGKSFPSGHAVTSWSVAAALAHAYPHNRWVQFAAYTAATGVSLLRFPARKHFPSDILVGGTLGYLVGSHLAQP